MLFHPVTLQKLAAFKISEAVLPDMDLLVLILDNTHRVNLKYLYNVLYSYKVIPEEIGEKRMIMTGLKTIISNYFVKHYSSTKWVCFASSVPSELQLLLEEARTGPPTSIGFSEPNLVLELSENISGDNTATDTKPAFVLDTPTKRKRKTSGAVPLQTNKLSFEKTEYKPVEIRAFEPLDLSRSTFVYNRHKVILETQRKRSDLINPVKLQFIKHYDQRRPPVYRKRGILLRRKYSYQRFPEVISYEEDSSEDWDAGDPISEISEIESISSACTESGDEWVEKDSSSEEEVVVRGKRPVISYVPVQVQVFFDIP